MTNRRDFLKGTMQGLAAGAMASALPNFAQARDLSPGLNCVQYRYTFLASWSVLRRLAHGLSVCGRLF